MVKKISVNKKNEWLLLDNQLCFRLYSASKALTSAYVPLLKPMELTYPQYLVMMVLWELNPLSVQEIGRRLGLDSGTLSPLLKKLEAKKIVIRSRDKLDERSVSIKLTSKGIDLKKKALGIPTKLLCKMDLKINEITEMRKQLDNLLENLSK